MTAQATVIRQQPIRPDVFYADDYLAAGFPERLAYPWPYRGPHYFEPLRRAFHRQKIIQWLLEKTQGERGLAFAIMRNPFNRVYDRLFRWAGLLTTASDAPRHDLSRGMRVREVPPPVFDLKEARKQEKTKKTPAANLPGGGPKGGAKAATAGNGAAIDGDNGGALSLLRSIGGRGRRAMLKLPGLLEDLWGSDDDYYESPMTVSGASFGSGDVTGVTRGSSPEKKEEDKILPPPPPSPSVVTTKKEVLPVPPTLPVPQAPGVSRRAAPSPA